MVRQAFEFPDKKSIAGKAVFLGDLVNRIVRGDEIRVGVLHPHRGEVFGDRKMQGIFEKTGEIGGRHRNLGSQLVQRQRLHIVFVNVGRHRAEPVIVAIFLPGRHFFRKRGRWCREDRSVRK